MVGSDADVHPGSEVLGWAATDSNIYYESAQLLISRHAKRAQQ